MKSKFFTVYDSKTEVYLQPFLMQTKGAAIRAFADTVNDQSSQFAKHPEDFTLFEIGEYDDTTANMIAYDVKQPLGLAKEFQR